MPCYVSLSPAGIWSHVLEHELSIGGRGKIKVTKHMEIDVRRGFLYLDFHMFHDKAKKHSMQIDVRRGVSEVKMTMWLSVCL